MAKTDGLDNDAKVQLLRELAHQVRRKLPVDEVLRAEIDRQLQAGRRRLFRPAADALNSDDGDAGDGVVGALRALELVGDEAGRLFSVVIAAKDHRLLANALSALAEFQAQAED